MTLYNNLTMNYLHHTWLISNYENCILIIESKDYSMSEQ